MKIYFDNADFNSTTGPNTFAHRLAVQLSNFGHTIADPDDYDVALAFIQATRDLNYNKPIVQRLDGIWFKPQDFERANQKIRNLYNKSDVVVFQSEFDKKMIESHWEQKDKNVVIHNGIELKKFDRHIGLDALKIGSNKPGCEREPYEHILVCSANWHPQKRLYDNVRLFEYIRENFLPKSCLIIMGNSPDISIANPHVFYAGSVPHDMCLQIYATADWFIHLAWLDHCPNVVVEALSQGLPVICTDSGGTKEIVRDNGIILADSSYNFELMDYDKPKRVDFSSLLSLPKITVDPSYLDIELVARKYENIFVELLQK